jgi:hypothetical protein
MPHGSDKACHARLTQIDPILVWINAERRLMGTQQKELRDRARNSYVRSRS